MYPNYPTNQPGGYPNQSNPPYGGYGMSDPNQAPYGGPPQSQYGAPPQNQYGGPPQNQYGAPGYPQQGGYPPAAQGGYGMPDPNQNQYGGGAPPQSQYGAPGGYQQSSYPPPAHGYGGSSYDPPAHSGSSFPPYQPAPPVNNPSLNNFGYPTQPVPPVNQSYGGLSYPPAGNQYPPAGNPYPAGNQQPYPPANPYPPASFDQLNAHGPYNPTNPGAYPPSGSNFGQASFSEGTVKAYQPFNPMDDAAKLYKAMKGFGTDEKVLIDILCRRSYGQRKEIATCYKTSYGKDLLENLKSELKGNLELVFKALMKSPAQLEAHDLKKAIDGAGTDEEALIDVMCTKTNTEMMELKQAYQQMYHKDLERDVGSDVSGYFKRLIVSLAAAHRSEAPPDFNKAMQQANELHSAGARSFGTDEVTFNRVFASESFAHLKVVFDEYYKKTGSDIEKAVKSEMSGYVEKAFCAIINTARNPATYYAQRLHDAMGGAGTRDRTLVRIIVTRSEKDMVQIKSEFQRRYGKTLESFIKDDCTGDYERALRILVGDPSLR